MSTRFYRVKCKFLTVFRELKELAAKLVRQMSRKMRTPHVQKFLDLL